MKVPTHLLKIFNEDIKFVKQNSHTADSVSRPFFLTEKSLTVKPSSVPYEQFS